MENPAFVARVEAATKTYGNGAGRVNALDGVSLGIESGRFTAIMGPSGSGKSTLMHVMAGLDTVTAGRVFLGDTEITTLGDAELTVLRRRRVGFVFQSFNLVPTLDVRANIRLPFEIDGRRPTVVQQDWMDQLIDSLGLADRLDHTPNQLSGGQQQRVAIARALVTRPPLLLADEPTGNLDTRTSYEVLELLQRLNRAGITIVLVTHEADIAACATRVIRMRDGRIQSDARNTPPLDAAAALAALPRTDEEAQAAP